MAKGKRWGGLRPEPYNPNARDRDGDGIVQEGTAWERPGGTRLLDAAGRAIRSGESRTDRPADLRVVDGDGKPVDYTPTYARGGGVSADAGAGKGSPLGDHGSGTLKERGLRDVRTLAAPPPPPAPAETAPSAELVRPDKPRRPREPSPIPLSGLAAEMADEADGDFERFAELLNRQGVTAFDYETTGFDAGDLPVQIGAVKVKDGKEVGRLNLYINPGQPLGDWAKANLKRRENDPDWGDFAETEVPLTDEWLAENGLSPAEAHRQLVEFFGDSVIVAHNLAYDGKVLDKALAEAGIDFAPEGAIDSLQLARQLVPRGEDGPPGHSLDNLATFFDLDNTGWHSADADAENTLLILDRTLSRAKSKPPPGKPLDSGWQERDFAERSSTFRGEVDAYDKALAKYERDLADYEFQRSRGADGDPPEPPDARPPATTGERIQARAEATRELLNSGVALAEPVMSTAMTPDQPQRLTDEGRQAVSEAVAAGREIRLNAFQTTTIGALTRDRDQVAEESRSLEVEHARLDTLSSDAYNGLLDRVAREQFGTSYADLVADMAPLKAILDRYKDPSRTFSREEMDAFTPVRQQWEALENTKRAVFRAVERELETADTPDVEAFRAVSVRSYESRQRLERLQQAKAEAEAKLRLAKREALVEALRDAGIPLGGTIETRHQGSPGEGQVAVFAKAFDEAAKYVPSEWIRWVGEYYGPINARGLDRRGWFAEDNGQAQIAISAARSFDPESGPHTSVALHEFIHAVEAADPRLRAAETAFYWHRTRPDEAVGYRSDDDTEVVRPDQFFDVYAGKSYGGSQDDAYELLSLGMEVVFGAREHQGYPDDEYLDWMLGVIAATGVPQAPIVSEAWDEMSEDDWDDWDAQTEGRG
jgi:DNA polymerase III epsilon subunit-like protein